MIEYEYYLNPFHKAVDMMRHEKPLSHRSGLYILHDMVTGSYNDTYIPCVDVLADWLRSENNSPDLIGMAGIIFKEAIKKIPWEYIEMHKDKYDLSLWPNLQDAILISADLGGIDFKNANMQGAKLLGAFISGANMENTQGLTKEQVLKTTWWAYESREMIALPRFPHDLQYSHEVQEWLKSPPFAYDFKKVNPPA